jgi:hypothetical protein
MCPRSHTHTHTHTHTPTHTHPHPHTHIHTLSLLHSSSIPCDASDLKMFVREDQASMSPEAVLAKAQAEYDEQKKLQTSINQTGADLHARIGKVPNFLFCVVYDQLDLVCLLLLWWWLVVVFFLLCVCVRLLCVLMADCFVSPELLTFCCLWACRSAVRVLVYLCFYDCKS